MCFLIETTELYNTDIYSHSQNDKNFNHFKDVISKEKIHIKGLLFLTNFQLERLDKSEQEALINYNRLFPLKRFWKQLILIFTHYYCDPDGDTLEEMIQMRDETNKIIFSKIMDKVKNISDVIDYKDLTIKYYNSQNYPKKEKQIIQNGKNKEDLELLLNDLCKLDPMFCNVEVSHIKNKEIEENGKKYLTEYEKIAFFDFYDTPIKEKINIIKKEPIN